MVAFGVSAALAMLPFSEHWRAGWVFQAAPITSPGIVFAGTKKMFLMHYFLPMFVGLWLFFAVHWQNPSHAIVHCGIGLAYMSFVFHAASAMTPARYPFSIEPQLGGMQSRLLAMLLAIMTMTLFYGFLARWAYGRIDMTAYLAIATALAAWLMGRYSQWVIDRRLTARRLPVARPALPTIAR